MGDGASIIRIDKVAKKYCRTLRRAMIYGALDLASDVLGVSSSEPPLRAAEFWALDEVSLEVAPGESVGIVGRNGSGKSTLLKLLGGTLLPDRGRVEIDGRVGALIEVGAGFHPMLSGRENVVVNGLILGMTQREIDERFERIVEFAELGEFIDMPIKTYSSGMLVRLGFAVAIHAPVEILLVDEILAVGDRAFAIKCMRAITRFRERGGSVVLVTHNMHNVKFVCDRAVWLDGGRVREDGEAFRVADVYEETILADGNAGGEVHIHDDCIEVVDMRYPATLDAGEVLEVEVEIECSRRIEQPIFNLHLHASRDDSVVFSHHSDLEGFRWPHVEGRHRLVMKTQPLELRRGHYALSFTVSERDLNNHLFWHYKRYPLLVDNPRQVFGTFDAGVTYELDPPERAD